MQITETQRIGLLIERASSRMSMAQIVSKEIKDFRASPQYQMAIEAEDYFRNRSAVQSKTNQFENRSNTKIEHGYIRRLTNQKVNTLLAQPFSISTKNTAYGDALSKIIDDTFRAKIYGLGRSAIKQAIGWIIPGIDDEGNFTLTRVPFTRLIPLWKDAEHTQMDEFIYFYPQVVFRGAEETKVWRAEYWNKEGVWYFVNETRNGSFMEDVERGTKAPHLTVDGQAYNWTTAPIIWCKYNEEELPLHYFIKELVDDYNWQKSVTADVLRDIAKFIYKVKGYGGTDVDEFIRDLREALMVKLKEGGDVDKLQPDLDITAVVQLLDMHRRDIYENGGGVDTQNPELSALSARAQRLRFTDLITDCNGLANELKAGFKRLKIFIDAYFAFTRQGEFYDVPFEITFNMDLPTDETEIFQNAQMAGLKRLSQRTILSNIPWVEDVDAELERIEEEEQKEIEERAKYGYPPVDGEGPAVEDDEE